MPEQGDTKQPGAEQKGELKSVMTEAMAKLEAKNAEMGGGILVGIGENEKRALIFQTPTITDNLDRTNGYDRTVRLTEVLIATTDGYKLLRIEGLAPNPKFYNPNSNEEKLKNILKIVQKNFPVNNRVGGFEGREQRLVVSEGYNNIRTRYFDKEGEHRKGYPTNKKVKLLPFTDSEKVLSMIRVNMDNVKGDQEEVRRKEEEYKQSVESHIQASQRLDEVLG